MPRIERTKGLEGFIQPVNVNTKDMVYNFRVRIHLGAHKTATTFLQNWLLTHQAYLRTEQIAYLPLHAIRNRFMTEFGEACNGQEISEAKVAELRELIFAEAEACKLRLDDAKVLLISEENLLGTMYPLYGEGKLYPFLKPRMDLLARIFVDYEIEGFLSIRNYADYYASAYSDVLKRSYLVQRRQITEQKSVKTFASYLAGLDLEGNRWRSVVDTIDTGLGVNTRVWPYESLFPGNAYKLLSALLGRPVLPEAVDESVRDQASLRRRGLQAALQCREFLTDSEMVQLVTFFVEKLAYNPPDQKLGIEDLDTLHCLHEIYQDDLDALSARLIQFGNPT
jgi:hypothetical protein